MTARQPVLGPPTPTVGHLRKLAGRIRHELEQVDAALGAVKRPAELVGLVGLVSHVQGDARSLTESLGRVLEAETKGGRRG